MAPHIPNLLVVTIDGLSSSFLGPYGNTWVPTPALNAWSAESLLAENCYIESVELAATYGSYWHGGHPLATDPRPAPSLLSTWKQAGYRTAAVTDRQTFLDLPGAELFDEHVLLSAPPIAAAAEELEETNFAHLMKLACAHLEQLPAPQAMWVHASGLRGAWDAPQAIREQLRTEEDPPALTLLDSPEFELGSDYDPDLLLGYTQAYAAQVMSVDFGLGELRAWLATSGRARDTLVVLTSPRGYLVGQQGYVGGERGLLEDLVHVPLIVRYPDGSRAAQRELGLLTSRDVHQLLDLTVPWTPPARDRVLMTSSHECALRTPAWHLRGGWNPAAEGADAAFTPRELYAKPDDRFEVNNVLTRAQEVTEQLSAELLLALPAARRGKIDALPPLGELLVDTAR